MGIIPLGSGNGLARHLGISMNFNKSLKKAINGTAKPIDTLTWNDRPFFCTGGIGFDAEVASDFSKGKRRGILNYIRATFKIVLKYKATNLIFKNDFKEELFSITIANANQYGNNAFISPYSNLQDAQFEVVKIKKGNFWQIGQLGISLFLKRIHEQSNVEIFSTDNYEFIAQIGTKFHLDGESLRTEDEVIKIKLFSKNLKVVF
jgi:diacylglycerol kinase family enzyme